MDVSIGVNVNRDGRGIMTYFRGHIPKVGNNWKKLEKIFTIGVKCDISRVIYLVHFVLIDFFFLFIQIS